MISNGAISAFVMGVSGGFSPSENNVKAQICHMIQTAHLKEADLSVLATVVCLLVFSMHSAKCLNLNMSLKCHTLFPFARPLMFEGKRKKR